MPTSKKDSGLPRASRSRPGEPFPPVIAPKRTQTVWYKRPKVQAAVAFAVIFLGILLFNIFKDLSESRNQRRLEVRSIEQFERKLQLFNAPLEGIYSAISSSPEQLIAGTLSVDDYRKQAEGWVAEFRKLYTGIKDTEVRQELDELVAAKGSFAQGAVILVDGTKSLLNAASVEGDARQAAITLGRNLLTHGGAVISMGERQMGELKNEFELNDPPVDLPAPIVPEEEAPPPVVTQTPVTPDPLASPPAVTDSAPSSVNPGADPSPAASPAP